MEIMRMKRTQCINHQLPDLHWHFLETRDLNDNFNYYPLIFINNIYL